METTQPEILNADRTKVPLGDNSTERVVPAPAAARPDPPTPTLRRMVREDQICMLTFDRPGSAANIFDLQTLKELGDELEFIAGAPQIKGLILTSAKRSIFIAGADLEMVSAASSVEEGRALIEAGQAVMNRLAALPIPTVAAIHGAAVGGGCELCLACDYRVASDDRATKIGLPETQLGLLPAWGGSTRLPRLIGLPKALEIILAGKSLAAKPALKRGLVDELAPPEYLIDVAVRMIGCGKARRPGHWLVNNRLAATLMAVRLRAQLMKKTRGNYPAVIKALEVVTKGVSRGVSGSLRLERDGILELMQSEACRNLIRVFFLQERAKKQGLPVRILQSGLINTGLQPGGHEREEVGAASAASRECEKPLKRLESPRLAFTGLKPGANESRGVECEISGLRAAQATDPKPIKRAAVIGGGVMGAGIAQWLSARHLPVILRDNNTQQVAKGMAGIAKVYEEGVKRHLFTTREARDGLDRVSPAPAEVPLRHVDLVIEAAVENFALKEKIFQRLDDLAGDETLLATNTSALPVSELAAATRRPERVLGLHFFNPVHRMQLVEVISARQTSPEVVRRALRFVQQIGKLPVLVKDSPGFLVNRILMPYLIEAGNLFAAGASINTLDEAMLDFGMPMGPMRLLDEVGVDVALHVAQTLAAAYKDRLVLPSTLSKMVRDGLLGRKSGGGFYLYSKKKEPHPNPRVAGYQTPTANQPSPITLQERMVLLMVNEAARCLEEDIVTEPADVDFAMIMGTGFAPFRGGPLRYADTLGPAEVVGAMECLVDTGAAQFAPCDLLRRLAATGKRFYPSK